MRLTITSLLFLLIGFNTGFAQQYDPVKWSFSSKKVSDTEYDLVYKAKIEKGWYVYSQYLESDEGPVATEVTYEGEKAFSTEGKSKESGDKITGHDKMFDMIITKYKGNFIITQRIKVTDAAKPVAGYLTYMTCDDSKCLPPTDVDFSFDLGKSSGSAPATTGDTGSAEKPKEVEKPADTKETTKPVPGSTFPSAKDKAEKDRIVKDEAAKKAEAAERIAKAKAERERKDAEARAKTEAEKAKKEKIAKTNAQKIAESKKKKIAAAEEEEKEEDKEEVEEESANLNIGNLGNRAGKGKDLLQPVKWSLSTKETGKGEYDLIYKAKVDKGWYVYSQYLESDEGPVATEITYEGKIIKVGKAKESGNEISGYDKMFDMNITKYKNDFTITQSIKTTDANSPVKGYLTFMVCDDSKCLPPEDMDFSIIPATGKGGFVGQTANSNAATTTSSTPTQGAKINGNVIDQAREKLQTTYKAPIGNCGAEDVARDQNFLWTFIFGFLGGLVALITPCVFPMIPLTVSYFTKGSKDKASGIRNGLLYGLSIIVIYVGLGLLITAVFGATALNELSTNWFANLLFFAIFVIFAISFFGYFEITLPSSWANKSDAMADKGGLIGIFFMAFTLSIVSFSCTGPIIGSALVESATSTYGPAVVMLGFSSALALPFGLFAAFPALLNSLPQSGGWMTSVKVVLGFIELALALKFLSVADMTMGWGILPYELFMGLWVLIALLTALYLFGFIRFPHDSPMKKLPPLRGVLGVGFLALAGYLATGFIYNKEINSYNALSLMSGLAPPTSYNVFLEKTKADQSIKEKYSSFTKCANDIDCFKDYYEGVAYAREVGKPVLLDFTGHGCVNCRKTEEHIWVKKHIKDKLEDDFVLVSLYVDERKKLDQTYISAHTDKKLRNIGHKWADFQIVNLDQNSQPLYVMMTEDEQILAAPRGYKTSAPDYNTFLECGLKTYADTKKTGMN